MRKPGAERTSEDLTLTGTRAILIAPLVAARITTSAAYLCAKNYSELAKFYAVVGHGRVSKEVKLSCRGCVARNIQSTTHTDHFRNPGKRLRVLLKSHRNCTNWKIVMRELGVSKKLSCLEKTVGYEGPNSILLQCSGVQKQGCPEWLRMRVRIQLIGPCRGPLGRP